MWGEEEGEVPVCVRGRVTEPIYLKAVPEEII